MVHFDAATGGVTLATALNDGVIATAWDELFRLLLVRSAISA